MSLRVINDVHIGASRVAGTTPTSQYALRQHLVQGFGKLLPTEPQDLMILGDLFDTYSIPIFDLLQTYQLLASWVSKRLGKLYLIPGNHDLSRVSNVLSSFQFMGKLLAEDSNVLLLEKAGMTPYGYVIPHVANQELFNLELAKVPKTTTLFLHCNYDNGFAAQSDQSLNLSREQADALPVERIVLAHEHHQRASGKVIVPGNQIASSVSDWLGPDTKSFVTIEADGTLQLTAVEAKLNEFVELDWQELKLTDHKFVRICGKAPTEQATAVVSLINKFRTKSPALVITNAVRILSEDQTEAFAQSLESVQAFSVWTALEELFNAEEMTVLRQVAEKAQLC